MPVSSICTAWAAAGDLPAVVTAVLGTPDPVEVEAMLLVASEQLYALSGRRWSGGGCDRTVEIPCATSTGRRGGVAHLVLPDYPVTTVSLLERWDGTAWVAVPVEEWRLVNGRHLEAVDPVTRGHRWWPWSSVRVTYVHGAEPPAGGRWAAAELAGQLLLSRAGSDACQLPTLVQSVTRQGVSMQRIDTSIYKDGLTGLPDVDAWLTSVNPRHRGGRASVWSPDTARRARLDP